MKLATGIDWWYVFEMLLSEYIQREGRGAATRLCQRSGVSWTTIHILLGLGKRRASGTEVKPGWRPEPSTVARIAAATDGQVSMEEIYQAFGDPPEVTAARLLLRPGLAPGGRWPGPPPPLTTEAVQAAVEAAKAQQSAVSDLTQSGSAPAPAPAPAPGANLAVEGAPVPARSNPPAPVGADAIRASLAAAKKRFGL